MNKASFSTSEQEFLISLRLSAPAFANHLTHRSKVANYLATFASSKQKNPPIFTKILAEVLNQLLEVIFQQQDPGGDVTITIVNLGQLTGIKLEFPVDYASKAVFVRLARALKKSDLPTIHKEGLDQPLTAELVGNILTVALRHQGQLEAETVLGRNAVQLFMQLDLEAEAEKLAI